MVNEEVHHSLRDLVSDGFADDVEIRRNEAANKLRFKGFTLGELGIVLLNKGRWGLQVPLVDFREILPWIGGVGGI